MAQLAYPWNTPYFSSKYRVGNFSTEVGQDYSTQIYGRTIPLSQGKRLAIGAPIWASTIRTVTEFFSVGAGPSQPGDDVSGEGFGGWMMGTNRWFYRDAAFAFGYALAPADEYPEPKITRMWINGVLAYDARTGIESQIPGLDWTFYTGTETQLPDATIAAAVGAENAVAYRGMMYIVIRNMLVASQVNSNVVDSIEAAAGPGSAFRDRRVQAGILAAVTNSQNANDLLAKAAELPDVRVELQDGHVVSATYTEFAELPSAVRHHTGTPSIIDWFNRRAVTFSGASDSTDNPPRYITTWDLDTQAMIEQVAISGNVYDSAGTPTAYDNIVGSLGAGTFQAVAWDMVGDLLLVQYGAGNSAPLIVINRSTGVIVGQLGFSSGSLASADVDGGDPITSGKAIKSYLFPVRAAPAYVGTSQGSKCVFGFGGFILSVGTPYFAIVSMEADGSITDRLGKPGSIIGLPSAIGISSITSFPMDRLNQQLSSQDAVFLVGNGRSVVQVYATKDEIKGTIEWVDTFPASYSLKTAFYDDEGATLIYTDGTTFRARRHAYGVREESVAGFSGVQMALVEEPIFDTLIDDIAGDNSFNESSVYNSLLDGGRLLYFGASNNIIALDLKSGISSSIYTLNFGAGDFIPISYSYNAQEDALYGAAQDSTSGDGFYKITIGDAPDWEAQTIGDYERWLALKAGYADVDIVVNGDHTDPVIGCYMDAEYGFNDLFNSLGRLYDFAYFVSEGKIKFIRTSRNPVKATGTLTWSIQPTDGQTVTIGSQTYRFKNTLALPFDVKIGASVIATKDNFEKAVNLSGVAGTNYETGTTISIFVTAASLSATQTVVTAIHGGAGGNSIGTTESSNMSWGSITLQGGEDALSGDTLTKDDLAPVSEGGAGDSECLVTTLSQQSDVPKSIQVFFWDINKSYEYANELFTADTETQEEGATGADELRTPIVMTNSEAYRRASKLGFRVMEQTIGQELRLPWRYLAYEPTDTVTITLGSYTYIIRMNEITFNGDMSISIGGVNFATQDNITIQDQPEQPAAQSGVEISDGVAIALDAPSFTSEEVLTSDIVFKTGVRSVGQLNFGTAAFQQQEKDVAVSPSNVYVTAEDIPAGIVTILLPDTSTPFTTDLDTELIVASRSIFDGHLNSISDTEFLEGRNMVAVGQPGRWEYIFFQNVEWISANSLKLTGLARGRRGTEVNTGNHLAGDQVLLIRATGPNFKAEAWHDFNLPVAEEGDDYRFTALGLPRTREPGSMDVTVAGLSLYPFAPTQVGATLESGDDVEITWLRRDRRSANDWVTEDTELSETTEEYELDIMDGSTVVRTVTGLTSPLYLYDAADQVTDGFTTPMAEIKVRVYQVGALGRGFMKEITVNVV